MRFSSFECATKFIRLCVWLNILRKIESKQQRRRQRSIREEKKQQQYKDFAQVTNNTHVTVLVTRFAFVYVCVCISFELTITNPFTTTPTEYNACVKQRHNGKHILTAYRNLVCYSVNAPTHTSSVF